MHPTSPRTILCRKKSYWTHFPKRSLPSRSSDISTNFPRYTRSRLLYRFFAISACSVITLPFTYSRVHGRTKVQWDSLNRSNLCLRIVFHGSNSPRLLERALNSSFLTFSTRVANTHIFSKQIFSSIEKLTMEKYIQMEKTRCFVCSKKISDLFFHVCWNVCYWLPNRATRAGSKIISKLIRNPKRSGTLKI